MYTKKCNDQIITVDSKFDVADIQKLVGAYLAQCLSGLNKHLWKALNDVDAQKTTLNRSEINYLGFLLKCRFYNNIKGEFRLTKYQVFLLESARWKKLGLVELIVKSSQLVMLKKEIFSVWYANTVTGIVF